MKIQFNILKYLLLALAALQFISCGDGNGPEQEPRATIANLVKTNGTNDSFIQYQDVESAINHSKLAINDIESLESIKQAVESLDKVASLFSRFDYKEARQVNRKSFYVLVDSYIELLVSFKETLVKLFKGQAIINEILVPRHPYVKLYFYRAALESGRENLIQEDSCESYELCFDQFFEEIEEVVSPVEGNNEYEMYITYLYQTEISRFFLELQSIKLGAVTKHDDSRIEAYNGALSSLTR